MASDNEIIAAEYRYFTTDLLSNEVLMEIPFSGVSYERALKAGGSFSGNIPAIPSTKHLELYNTTMPGQTGLYVVRNGKCIWGGIIWSRSYDVKTNVLSVDASEFTSYLHHRLIWKTVNYQYGATVTVGGGVCAVQFDNGSTTALVPGASVQLEFYDPEDFTYNGYYNIAGTPPPTTDSFTTTLAAAVATIVDIQRAGNIVTVDTDGFHGFNSGDVVTLQTGTSWDGTYVITADQGSASSVFTFSQIGANTVKQTVTGTATRPIPDGVYEGVTVTTRADTYDYMRGLVTSIFEDFVGVDFADDYLTPGLSYEIDIINKKLGQTYATMKTAEPHQLAVGQTVKVGNVGFPFDGEFEVIRTPNDTTFMYNQGGTLASTPIAPIKTTVVARAVGNYVATVYASTPHGYAVGQTVTVDAGADIDGLASVFNGLQTITAIPTPSSFSYSVIDTSTASKTTLTQSTATVNNVTLPIASRDLTSNVVSVSTASTNNFAVGDTVTVRNLNLSTPIVQKSLDVANQRATITTSVPHQLTPGDPVQLTGLQDAIGVSTAYNNPVPTATTTYAKRVNLFSNPSGQNTSAGYSSVTAGPAITTNPGSITSLNGIPATGPLSVGIILETMTVGGNGKLLPNRTYTFSAAIGGTVGGAHLVVSGSGVSSVVSPDPSPLTSTIFNESVVFTTGASGSVAFSVYNALVIPSANTADVRFRFAKVELGSSVRGYFDGSTNASGVLTYGWTGTASASPSAEYYVGFANSTQELATTQPHNFKAGDIITVQGVVDHHRPQAESVTNGLAQLSIGPHNMGPGDTLTISDINDYFNITSSRVASQVATVTLDNTHGFSVNDSITIANMSEQVGVIAKEIQNYTVILITSTQHNIQVSQQIQVSGLGAPFDSPDSDHPWVVTAVTENRIYYSLPQDDAGANATQYPTQANGSVYCSSSVFNGNFVVTAVPNNTSLQFGITAHDVPTRGLTAQLSGASPVNGTHVITLVPSLNDVQFMLSNTTVNLSNRGINANPSGNQPLGQVNSVLNGTWQLTSVTRDVIRWVQNSGRANGNGADTVSGGFVSANSIFRGDQGVISVPTPTTFTYGLAGVSNVSETPNALSAYAQNIGVFNGVYTITAVDPTTNTFRYSKTHADIVPAAVSGYGSAMVSPIATVSTYGSYPGNTDIGIDFSSRSYSGVNVTPTAYRGYALTNAGSALDSYSGTTDGFDYRIDCEYDESTNKFSRTFILIPIDFPNPPPAGEASPPSRFGADKLVFEYPGNVIDVKLDESAENSATRFFAVGDANLGDDTANPYAAASATDLLNAENSRKWPILDDSESLSDVTDENVLYAYASQYLAESRPPSATFTVSIDGSLQPTIDTFSPGDWCSIIVDDEFLKQRLASDLEPRDTVIVRKIDSYKVSVPDGVTFPETVDLTLVAEWDVDKKGS